MRLLASAATFSLPLLALVLLWAVVVGVFDVDPRLFPGVPAVGRAAAFSQIACARRRSSVRPQAGRSSIGGAVLA